jgi:hypothetical protein
VAFKELENYVFGLGDGADEPETTGPTAGENEILDEAKDSVMMNGDISAESKETNTPSESKPEEVTN